MGLHEAERFTGVQENRQMLNSESCFYSTSFTISEVVITQQMSTMIQSTLGKIEKSKNNDGINAT